MKATFDSSLIISGTSGKCWGEGGLCCWDSFGVAWTEGGVGKKTAGGDGEGAAFPGELRSSWDEAHARWGSRESQGTSFFLLP